MVCTSCGQQLLSSEAFCPRCGRSTQQSQPSIEPPAAMPHTATPYTPPPTTTPYAPPPAATPYAPPPAATPYTPPPAATPYTPPPTNAKPGLRGFAKGWTIFTIVIYSAYLAQNLTNLFNPGMAKLLLPALTLLGLMLYGSVLIFKMKPYGFYIQLGAAFLFLTLSGSSNGTYLISTSGSLYVLITWLATKSQLDYAFWLKRKDRFIMLEGFPRSWMIFILGYVSTSVIVNLSGIGNNYYNPYPLYYVIAGSGMIIGAVLLMRRLGWGVWVMLASSLFRLIVADFRTYGNVYRMNDAEINRLFLSIILVLAPALLSWLFTHKQIYYSKTKDAEREHEV